VSSVVPIKSRQPETDLVLYDQMCQAIAEAYAVDEVKDIRDKALAIEIYSRQAKNVENERKACEIRLRAERKWGKLRNAEVIPPHRPSQKEVSSDTRVSNKRGLDQLGVSFDQSAKWQKLAEIPEDDFEEALRAPKKPSTSGIIASFAPPKQPKRNAVDDDALWLWGRLEEIERRGLLDTDPADILDTMLDHMKESTLDLAPRVAQWLRGIK
jgi:hypothetical protein